LSTITESAVEDLAIQRLEEQGFSFISKPEFAPDKNATMWTSFENVLLIQKVNIAMRFHDKDPDTALGNADTIADPLLADMLYLLEVGKSIKHLN
jgi:hypothetical protein